MALIEVVSLPIHGKSTLRTFKKGFLETFLRFPPYMGMPNTGEHLTDLLHKLDPMALHKSVDQNLITSVGKAMVGDWAVDDEATGLTYHAIGTDNTTPVVGDTVLGTESNRKLWTAKDRTANVVTLSVFYLASESTFDIEECGVFGGAAASATPDSGILFSHYLQPYDNTSGLVDLTFEYELTIG